MWGPGRGNSGGSWLPDELKTNMWHGRGNSGRLIAACLPPTRPIFFRAMTNFNIVIQ